MNKKTTPGLKIICLNRKASFNYFFEDLLEAGIVLKGSEIKSVREGKVNIADGRNCVCQYAVSSYVPSALLAPRSMPKWCGCHCRLQLKNPHP